MQNTCAMTVDVEEYFQVEAFADSVDVKSWGSHVSRLEFQMERLLTLFEQTNSKATFFTLGWVAEKHPTILKKIVAEGHELASHGFMHQHLCRQSRSEFTDDITRAKKVLEDCAGIEVKGYRAPCFSIQADNEWAHDTIASAGYQYSSSSYPINHDLYGVPNAPATPYFLSNGLLEIPVTTSNWFGKTLPAGGGGYFRLLPYFVYRYLFAKQMGEHVSNFYTHPWEFDPEQPKLPGSAKSQFRHHVNQKSALNKLQKLCSDFNWTTMQQAYLGKEYPTFSNWKEAANLGRESLSNAC